MNFFADKHTFELIQLLKTTGVDDDLFLNIQKMVSSGFSKKSAPTAFFLQHALTLYKELQDRVEGLERQLDAHYQEAKEAFNKTSKGDKTDRFHYNQSRVKDLALAKDKSGKTLHLKRTIISMVLNETLWNLIVWYHVLSDISAYLLKKSEDEELVKTAPCSKMMQRREVLEKAIPQTMASFHAFWALQEEKYAERQRAVSGEEARLSSVLDSWLSIRADV